MKIAVSFLKSDNYVKCIEKINQSIADFVHADVCDGKYVESKNFTPKALSNTLKAARKKIDIHLMVQKPIDYIKELLYFDIETITIHVDIENLDENIDYIKSLGIKVGLAINPMQDANIIDKYLDSIDEVLIMSVIPGKGGQSFMPEVLEKVDYFNSIKDKHKFIVALDGGINKESIIYLDGKDVDLIVSGSFITDADDFNEQIKILKNKA